MTDAVALPPVGDGSRRRRRGSAPGPGKAPKAPKQRRERAPRDRSPRRRVLPILLVVVLVAVVAGALLLRDDGADGGAQTASAPLSGSRTSTLLLERDTAGVLTAATVLVAADAGGGVLLYVPPGTMLETPSLGLVPLRDAARDGDDLARVTLENLFGVRFDAVAAVDAGALTAAVQPSGSLTVRLPVAVERREGDRTVTAFPAGPNRVAPEAVGDLLSIPGPSDLRRMVRHQAFWDAWLAAIRAAPSSRAPVAGGLGGAGAAVATLARGSVTHLVLPVDALGGADELYKVDPARLDAVVPRVFPAAPARSSRITVQVLNGTGRPGATAAVLPALVSAGARVSLTGNADRFDYAATQVVFYDDANAAAATKLRQALGVGEVVRSRAGIGAVQVTVVVGADFPASSLGTSSTTTSSEGASP